MNKIPTENKCVLEAWLHGAWAPVATLSLADDPARGCQGAAQLTYLLEHGLAHVDERGYAAISAAQPVTLLARTAHAWPAVLTDLVPQGEGRRRLAEHLGIAAATPAADWPLLLAGAGNPIGHLRVREAADWLAAQPMQAAGWVLEDLCARDESFLESVQAAGLALGGSSGVQGEWPKLLMTQDAAGDWYLDHQLPDARAARHWLIKFARRDEPVYDLILRAEAAYHALAGELGLRVQGEVRYYQGLLLVERFDRRCLATGGVERIAQESLYAFTDRGGFDAALNHLQACVALAAHATEPAAEIIEYVWRDVLNLALGNRDNHGRNTAIQRFADGRIALSPIFDLAPMCLHPDAMARRMRWPQEERGRPDWRMVAAQLEEAGILAAGTLMDYYPYWLEQLQQVPERLRTLGCPERVLAATQVTLHDTLQALRRAC